MIARHKLIHQPSLHPVCVALAEGASLGPLEQSNQVILKVVVKIHQPNIWTHKINLVQYMTPRDVTCTILSLSALRSSVAYAAAES